jgi:lactose/raffinose/galactose permease
MALRPMLDKFSGALSNGVVGMVAVLCGMTGSATIFDITESSKLLFKTIMCGTPIVLVVISVVIYQCKFKITAKYHDQIVRELEMRTES